jgi:hypothetical protein
MSKLVRIVFGVLKSGRPGRREELSVICAAGRRTFRRRTTLSHAPARTAGRNAVEGPSEAGCAGRYPHPGWRRSCDDLTFKTASEESALGGRRRISPFGNGATVSDGETLRRGSGQVLRPSAAGRAQNDKYSYLPSS